MIAVDVGDHHVPGHGFQDALNFVNRGKHRGHAALVFRRKAGHFPAAGADRFQCVGEGQPAGRNQRSVFTQAVSHGEVRFDAVGGQESRQGKVNRQHRGLSNRGLA